MKNLDFDSKERQEIIDKLKSPWKEPISSFPPIPVKQNQNGGGKYFKEAAAFLAKDLKEAFNGDRSIVLFGDFDVDGTTSAAIMYIFSRLCQIDSVIPFVSKRSEGYGLNQKSIKGLLKELESNNKKTTIIMMDMGVSSYNESEILLQNGASVIVLDHHVPAPSREVAKDKWDNLAKKYPNKICAYDPLLFDNEEDLKYSCLSAAGLVFRVCFEVIENNLQELTDVIFSANKVSILPGGKQVSVETAINSMSKLTAIAQASDCMPFAAKGFLTDSWILAKDFETGGNVLAGIDLLTDATITASRVPWVIGPRLNAAGRLSDAFASFSLLLESDMEEAKKKLVLIDEVRTRVQHMTKHASTAINEDLLSKKGLAVLIGNPEKVKAGVIGIAAARASDKLSAPALYLTPEVDDAGNVILKGSMRRGPTDFSCEKFVLDMKELNIAISGGGHPAAAGITVRESEIGRLIDEAEKQQYNILMDSHYKVSVDEVIEYSEKIEAVLPFGKGHESAVLSVKALLSSIRPLMTSKSGSPEKWAYTFTIVDSESGRSLDIKALTSDMSNEQKELFDSLSLKKILNIPIETKIVVHDNLKKNSKWSRLDLRVLSYEKLNSENESTKEIALRVINKDSEGDKDSVLDEEAALADIKDGRPIIQVDCIEKNNNSFFLLRRPSKADIIAILGEKKAEELAKEHGGSWSRSEFGYFISSGNASIIYDKYIKDATYAIKNSEPNDEEFPWRYVFSSKAKDLIIKIKKEDDFLNNKKTNVTPFDIPNFTYIKKPMGFQYADVRLFLSNKVSLCNNDMGTGKTLESCMWSLMRLNGFYSDEEGNILKKDLPKVNEDRSHPVLIITLKGVQGQLAEEFESLSNLRASKVTSTDVREFLTKSGYGDKLDDDFEDDENEESESAKKIKPVKSLDNRLSSLFQNHYIKGSDFVVTTYDCIGRHPWILSGYSWSGLVLDEAHELKTINTLKTKAVLGEKIDGEPFKDIPVLAMTGTFSKNRPADWFPWVRITNADQGIYTSGTVKSAEVRFSMRFDGLIFTESYGRGGVKFMKSERKKPENGEELRRILMPYVVRRLKTEIGDIPKISVKEARIPSSGLYLSVLNHLENGVDLPFNIKEILSKHSLLSKDGGLSIENDEEDYLEEDEEDSKSKKNKFQKSVTKNIKNKLKEKNVNVSAESLAGKLALLSSLDKALGIINFLKSVSWLNEKNQTNEPFVILCTHRSALSEISEQLTKCNIDHFTMTQKDSAEQRRLKASAFQNGEKPVFLTTFGVGGTGLNLTKARRILMAGLPYTETLMAQGRDRVHRIGQYRPVEAIVLLQSASIDEAIWWLIASKGKANFATQTVDKLKKDALPSWAKGPIFEQAKASRNHEFKDEEGGYTKKKRGSLSKESEKMIQDDLVSKINSGQFNKKGFKK